MASVRKKGPTWYARFKDVDGQHREVATKSVTKAEAKALAVDLERQAERRRHGLEPLPTKMTFGELADLWLEKHANHRLRAAEDEAGRLRLHLKPALGAMQLSAVTPMVLEGLFNSKLRSPKNPKGMASQSVAHLRGLVRRIFNTAKRWRLWSGENPVELTTPIKLVKRKPNFVVAADIPPLLTAAGAIDPEWQAFCAVAIYSGLREGEILELRRTDLDLGLGLFGVERTMGNDTTKGRKTRWVPIVGELRPFLVGQLGRLGEAKAAYLFPGLRAHGTEQVRVVIGRMLKTTLIKAGLLERWDHVCRRKGCQKVEEHPDGAQRRCQACQMMLWPRPVPKKLTFHGLRHTFISHLLMKGANPVAVQRMAGHATLEITLQVYGHMVPDFMRAEAERLSFGVEGPKSLGPGSDSKEVSGERVDKKPEE